MHPAFAVTRHRPWPVPDRPWIWRQTWHDLLFLHWPIDASALRSLVPPPLEINEFAGTAWIAVTPFWISGATLRAWPDIPGASKFPELNVRTYVTLDDRPGVWFLSLDAGSRWAVWAARRLYHLPYVYARMRSHRTGDEVTYQSERPAGPRFAGRYAPAGPVQHSLPGTIEHFLTERYCLYARSPSGRLYRGEIHHVPWPLQTARAVVEQNDLLAAHGLMITDPPVLMHYAFRLDVVIWPLTRVALGAAAPRFGAAPTR